MEDGYYKNYFCVSHLDLKNRDRVWRVLCSFLQKKYIAEDSVILDLGAGYGSFINNIKAGEKYALDKNPIIKERAAPGVRTFVQDCTNLKTFEDNFFDVVFASNLLEHLERSEIEKTIVETKRVLKNGGKLILIQPNFTYTYKDYFDDYTHKQIFTHTSLADLLRAFGFKIISVQPKFMPYTMRSKLPTYSWLVKLYLLLPFKPFAGQMLIVAQK